MIFNSQKINTDPEPFLSISDGKRITRAKYLSGSPAARKAGWMLAPRHKYDNNPNPVLLSFRADAEESVGTDAGEFIETVSTLATHWLNSDGVGDGYATPAHIDHARKVLTRLASLASKEQEYHE